ncbi:MAG: chalcone isomerase family protein [Burkholderiales bacterium]
MSGVSNVPSRRRLLILAACLLASPVSWAADWTVAGHTYDEQATVAGEKLVLNGAGVRSVLMYQFFTAGLYVKQPSRDGQRLMADTGARRLRMRMLVEVSSEEFVKASRGGIQKRASPDLQSQLAARMDRFDAQVRTMGTLKKNDTVDLDYLPGRGLQMSVNQKVVAGEPIAGNDFFAALLDIYIGDRPVDAKLKAGLLGSKP